MQQSGKYADNKALFLGPQVSQYDGHMVMTNVMQPTRKKYVNIDTAFRDEFSDYDAQSTTVCTVSLPERINNVKSIAIRNVEVPISWNNISEQVGNTKFRFEYGGHAYVLSVSENQYTSTTLFQTISAQLTDGEYNLAISAEGKYTRFSNSGNTPIVIRFDVLSSGDTNRHNLKRTLGWQLGFRKTTYTIPAHSFIQSEGFYTMNTHRYLYLVVDEFVGGAPNSFIAPKTSSLVQKNILARIALDDTHYPYGTILNGTTFNGLLLSDRRTYTGKVDLQRFQLKLTDDYGVPMNLNGLEYSLCLEIEYE